VVGLKKDATIVFLDTVPFLFLFGKSMPSGKTVGEILQDAGYRFFVSNTCWNKSHMERWKSLESACHDFNHIEQLYHFVQQQLRARLDLSMLDELDNHLWGNLRKKFIETIEQIRSVSVFKEAVPDYEETEVVLLAILTENCASKSYACRTMVLFGDDIHSERLAKGLDNNIRIASGGSLHYPRTKCYTSIDFIASQPTRELLPEEYIDVLVNNYACLKVSSTDTSFFDEFGEQLCAEVIHPSAQAFALSHFTQDLEYLCDILKNLVQTSLGEMMKARFRSIVKKDPYIYERGKLRIASRFKKECSDLIKDFSCRHSNVITARASRRIKPALDRWVLQIVERAESLSKFVSIRIIDH